jgi:hypothetical protein
VTRVLPVVLVVLGVALLVETAWLGGGVVGYLFGALFVLSGAGRLWLQLRQ